jgi:hypothetical protein
MFWAICLLCVLVSAMSLGSMRLYGLYLEHRLAYITSKIATIHNKNASLEERYSSLLSPAKIYSYATRELNMVTARNIEVVRLDRVSVGDVALASLREPARDGVKGPAFGAFVQTAHAKD